MKLVQRLLEKLSGLEYKQDYLCTDMSSFSEILNIYLVHKNKLISDVTASHIFCGYSPLIIAIPQTGNEFNEIKLAFTQKNLPLNGEFNEKDAVAVLKLEKIYSLEEKAHSIHFFRGLSGKHRFLSFFHQYIISINDRLYNRRAGNVFLPGNRLKQIQIAYSIPRKISLITVGAAEGFNLFPTDLHGAVSQKEYIISLRHNGKACKQVTDSGQILLSDIEPSIFREVYSLGKNHMQDPKDSSKFPFSSNRSEKLQLPVPTGMVRYSELRLKHQYEEGIHMLLIFEILNHRETSVNPPVLSHVHNLYATWRRNKDLPGNYFQR